jgi:hypothetical protein
MRCPSCAEENNDDALICRACRNDLRVPEGLLAENLELKQQIVELRAELDQLLTKRAQRRTISQN